MIITNHGLDFFKVQLGDVVLAFNPPSESSDHSSSRFGADAVLSSIRHEDYSGGELLTAGGKSPFIINGPGEYEVDGIFIRGFESRSGYDGKEWINTIYTFQLEGMDLCFLGPLSDVEIGPEVQEELDDIDILFVPCGSTDDDSGIIKPAESEKLAVKLEPAVIVPTHFMDTKDDNIQAFLKEAGVDDVKPVEKLTIKPSDLSGKESDVVLIKPNV